MNTRTKKINPSLLAALNKEKEMVILLIASIAVIIVGMLIYMYAEGNYFPLDWLFAFFSGCLVVVGAAGLIGVIICGLNWRGSAVKAELINREYGTSYTQEEVFYASSVIETIRQLDRKRIEVNGDLMRSKDDKND